MEPGETVDCSLWLLALQLNKITNFLNNKSLYSFWDVYLHILKKKKMESRQLASLQNQDQTLQDLVI